MCAQRRSRTRPQREGGCLQTRKRGLTKTNPDHSLSWMSSLSICEGIHFCCLRHPGCGFLLRQPSGLIRGPIHFLTFPPPCNFLIIILKVVFGIWVLQYVCVLLTFLCCFENCYGSIVTYNAVLVSGVQQSESVIRIYRSIHFFLYRLLQATE